MNFLISIEKCELANYRIEKNNGRLKVVKFPDGSWIVGEIESKYKIELSNLKEVSQETIKNFLDEFSYSYFIIFYSKLNNDIYLIKDFSGCSAAYYRVDSERILLSNSPSYLREKKASQCIDEIGAFQFIYFEMPWKPTTIYSNVKSVLNDCIYKFNVISDDFDIIDNFDVLGDGNKYSNLREAIVDAHYKRLGKNNAIFLSGGLDSQVMSIVLKKELSVNDLQAFNFSVKGAISEAEDARKTARRLNIDFHPVVVDPAKEIDIESSFLNSSSPYIGSLYLSEVFSSFQTGSEMTFFGGQDTRLHTPALTKLDLTYWAAIRKFGTLSTYSFKCIRPILLGLTRLLSMEDEKKYRLKELIKSIDKPQRFLANRHFHIHKFPHLEGNDFYNEAINSIESELSISDFNDPRVLYNKIVKENWRKQYLFDIEYMIQSTRNSNNDCVMPFYDKDLAMYSASLDFKKSTMMTEGRSGHSSKKIKVNKYLLREAFKGELDHDLIFRDKAVCPTNHMFFNGGLRGELQEFIYQNSLLNTELGRGIYIEKLIEIAKKKDKKWNEADNALLAIIFNAMIISKVFKVNDN